MECKEHFILSMQSMSCLWMAWQCKDPGHQQPWQRSSCTKIVWFQYQKGQYIHTTTLRSNINCSDISEFTNKVRVDRVYSFSI